MQDLKALFFSLTPDKVLDAVEAGGVPVTGMCYPLNSLENRVYELEREDRTRVVAKFYRPGRWSAETILEEHRFLQELHEAEIPVCPPLPFPDGKTLHIVQGIGIHYALFPKVGGRAPEEFTHDQLRRLGALLARIHTVGASRPAPARKALTPTTYGREAMAQLEQSGFIPAELRAGLQEVTEQLCDTLDPLFDSFPTHRLHGDCHPGNLLWGSQGPFFLDFDDLVIGPAVQDVWMIVPSRDAEGMQQRDVLLEGYQTLRSFDRRSLKLVEGLRALRYLHYAAWISRRWDDPSFPNAFPHFATNRYFKELLQDLEEQLALINTALAADPSGDHRPTSKRMPRTKGSEFTPAGNSIQSSRDWEADNLGNGNVRRSAPGPERVQSPFSDDDSSSDSDSRPSSSVNRSQYAIRAVTPTDEDWQRVLMIRTEVFVEELDRDIDAELDGQEKGSFHFLATLPNGRAGGCLRLRPIPGRQDLRLDRLAVLYPQRKKGIGTSLLKAAEDFARQKGGVLEVILPDADPLNSVAFFERQGYRRAAEGFLTRKGYQSGRV